MFFVTLLLMFTTLIFSQEVEKKMYKKVLGLEDTKFEKDIYTYPISGTWVIEYDNEIIQFAGMEAKDVYLLYINKDESSGELAIYSLFSYAPGTKWREWFEKPELLGKVKISINHVDDGEYEISLTNKKKKRRLKIERNAAGGMAIFFDDSIAYGSKKQKSGATNGYLRSKEITDKPVHEYLRDEKAKEEMYDPRE